MSENVQHAILEANEMHDAIGRGDRFRSVIIAVVAVLAALGTLYAHHRSIGALTVKNQAILSQARASDAYSKYEAKQVRAQVAQALIASGFPRTEEGHKALLDLANGERQSSADVLAKAQALESASERDEARSEVILESYETLQLAVSFLQIAIVLVSISTLVRTRVLLAIGCIVSVVGLVFLVIGYFQA